MCKKGRRDTNDRWDHPYPNIGNDYLHPPISQVLYLDPVSVVQAALVTEEFLVHFVLVQKQLRIFVAVL
jgi:hypothetical protein